MNVCRRENCDQTPISDLGFCAEDYARYLVERQEYSHLAAAVRMHMPDVFSRLEEHEAERLAQFIVGHAANGTRGFDNDLPMRGEIEASFDALAEGREERASVARGLIRRTRGIIHTLRLPEASA